MISNMISHIIDQNQLGRFGIIISHHPSPDLPN